LTKDKLRLGWDEMYALVCEYSDKNECAPIKSCIYKNQKIGKWLQDRKGVINTTTDNMYQKLAKNKYVKINLDAYLKNKKLTKDKLRLGWDEMYALVCEYSDKNECAPIKSCIYKNQNIGMWLQDRKKKINNTTDNTYQKLAKNKYLKINLDEYLKKKIK